MKCERKLCGEKAWWKAHSYRYHMIRWYRDSDQDRQMSEMDVVKSGHNTYLGIIKGEIIVIIVITYHTMVNSGHLTINYKLQIINYKLCKLLNVTGGREVWSDVWSEVCFADRKVWVTKSSWRLQGWMLSSLGFQFGCEPRERDSLNFNHQKGTYLLNRNLTTYHLPLLPLINLLIVPPCFDRESA